jgi:hypothetical protein
MIKVHNTTIAVIQIMQKFIADNTPFSAYDITKTLKQCISAGDIIIDNAECNAPINEYFHHNDIRKILASVYINCGGANVLNKEYKVGYVLYTPIRTRVQKAVENNTGLLHSIKAYISRIAIKHVGENRTIKQLQGTLKGYSISALIAGVKQLNIPLIANNPDCHNNQSIFKIV